MGMPMDRVGITTNYQTSALPPSPNSVETVVMRELCLRDLHLGQYGVGDEALVMRHIVHRA